MERSSAAVEALIGEPDRVVDLSSPIGTAPLLSPDDQSSLRCWTHHQLTFAWRDTPVRLAVKRCPVLSASTSTGDPHPHCSDIPVAKSSGVKPSRSSRFL